MELLGKCASCGASAPVLGMFLGFGAGPRAIQCRCGGWSSTTVLYRLTWNVFSTWKYLFVGLVIGFSRYGVGLPFAAGGAVVVGGLTSLLVIPVTLLAEGLNKAFRVRDEGDELVERTAREAAEPRKMPVVLVAATERAKEKLVACPYCAALIAQDADQCRRCGRRLARTKSVLSRALAKCAGCARPYNPSFTQCPFCGKPSEQT